MFYIFSFLCLCLELVEGAPGKKIVGGQSTDISSVPYTVSVLRLKEHICGGSLIKPSYVLTAAHCVHGGNVGYYFVRAGSNYHMIDGERRKVIHIISHPQYNPNTKNFDAAILELFRPFEINKKIKPVPLASKEPEEGELVRVSGWGAIKENSRSKGKLHSVWIPVVSRQKCKKYFSEIFKITHAMICAGHLGGKKDACKGDSGGPAVHNGEQVGIVSAGQGCGRKNTPGIYTNVAQIKEWAASQMKN